MLLEKGPEQKNVSYENDVKLSWIVSTLKIFLLKLIQTFITNAAFLVPLLIEFVKFVIFALALFLKVSSLSKLSTYAKCWMLLSNVGCCSQLE